MTITIEPGIYIPGKCGVRIEDLCVVREDGLSNLVSANKEMMIL
jgi:Xaa-Pro aminopeptidase